MGQTLWGIIRDFNAILSPNEKIESLLLGKRYPHFGDFVIANDLYNLGFEGFPYTWHRCNLFERLPHALDNKAWVKSFSNNLVTHLPKIKFAHKPFFFNLKLDTTLPREIPFQFLAS